MATKTAYRLQLPYAIPEWPTVAKEEENNIIQHLVTMVKPIGDFRRRFVRASKGKRRKKRMGDDQKHASDATEVAYSTPAQMAAAFKHLTIGFNSAVRSLESTSQRSRPAILNDAGINAGSQRPLTEGSDLTAIFVCRSVLPDAVTASLPLMVATASLTHPQMPYVRLVQLPTNAESQLAEALYQPRVGLLGIRINAPGVDVLLALVRAAVGPVHAPWLEDCKIPVYLPVQIESIESLVGTKDKLRKRGSQVQPAIPEGKPRVARAIVAKVRKTPKPGS